MSLYQGAADYCRKLTAQSQSNFYYAFFFLPPKRREALYAVYAYCRELDDISDGDDPVDEKRRRLADWHTELERAFAGNVSSSATGQPLNKVALALGKAQRQFSLRKEDALLILQGCEMDLDKVRYATWEELRRYCYHVASAVGLLCVEIFGYRDSAARMYAEDLGLALQLTNILRDVGEDAGRGRIYLPADELRAYGVDEAEVLAGHASPQMRRLLRFQAQRARTHYLRARAALRGGDRRSLVVAEIMGRTYFELLKQIESEDYQVTGVGQRISLSRRRKMSIAVLTFGSCMLGLSG